MQPRSDAEDLPKKLHSAGEAPVAVVAREIIPPAPIERPPESRPSVVKMVEKHKEQMATSTVIKSALASEVAQPRTAQLPENKEVSLQAATADKKPPVEQAVGSVFTMADAGPKIQESGDLEKNPSMTKMNAMYFRHKKAGRVILSGLLGFATERGRSARTVKNRTDTSTSSDVPRRASGRHEQAPRAQASRKELRDTAPDVHKIHVMKLPELLKLAEHIRVPSGTLSELYQNRQIDMINLRKAIEAHAQGHDIDAFVNKSLEAKELQRELKIESKTDMTAGVNPIPDFQDDNAAADTSTRHVSHQAPVAAGVKNAADNQSTTSIPAAPQSTKLGADTDAAGGSGSTQQAAQQPSPSAAETIASAPVVKKPAFSTPVAVLLGLCAGAVAAGLFIAFVL